MKTIMDILAAVADPLRLRSLALMDREGEVCVCELVAALDASQPKVSRHLAVLRGAGVVADRRDAQWVYYRGRSGVAASICACGRDSYRRRSSDSRT